MALRSSVMRPFECDSGGGPYTHRPKLRRKDSSERERVRSLPETLLGRRSGDGESLVPIGPAVLERMAKIQIYKQTHNFRNIYKMVRLAYSN